MLGVSSIACKNNSTNNDTPPPEVKNYASLSLTSDSITNLIAVSTASSETLKTGWSIVIKFTDATTTTLSKAVDKDSKDTTIGAGDDAVSYSDGNVTFGKNIITGLTSGTTNNYTLTFDVAGENTNASISVVVGLTRATAVTKENIKACFTDFAIKDSESSSKHSFNLGGNSGSTYNDTEATFSDSDNGGGDFSISAFTSNSVFSDALGSEKLGKYFDNPAYGTPTGKDNQTLTLPLILNPKPEYEWSVTTYNLKFTLKTTSDKWVD